MIAEKPSVARDLARVLGVRPSGQHFFEGSDWVITWCIGHLVELDEPASYDARWKAWKLETLPMLPGEFRLRASKHAAPQLRAVRGLLRDRRFSMVVNACDAGREGELIFRYVYQYAGGGPPVRRLWISSLTDEAIRRGMAQLRPGQQLDALGDAARCRSEADWLVGMNATRAVTVRGRQHGHDALYSIGRVQTPTLAMIVQREQQIRAFVPRDYWEVRGEFFAGDGKGFSALWRHPEGVRLGSAEVAEELVERDERHAGARDPRGPRVERLRSRVVKEPPPLLFDLTSLQRTANRRFGFSAARTLELAQVLYERHKLLTYPRTDSRHLSSDMVSELPAVFSALAELPEYAAFTAPLLGKPVRPSRRVVDDSRVSDHHAIIPTDKAGKGAAGLPRDEQRLFDLVVRRFLGAFHPDAEIAVTEAWICVGGSDGKPPPWPSGSGAFAASGSGSGSSSGSGSGSGDDDAALIEVLPPPPDRYFARGRVRLVAGWQAVAGIDPDRPDRSSGREREGVDEELDSGNLPPLVEGQALDGRFSSRAKQTSPPRRYSEATLLAAMESAGKTIDDEALRAAMKDTGLGTPATRASIIETLLDRGYIVRDKQALQPTVTGMSLIAALPVANLGSPELTGAWEARLARIARGQDTRASFMADISRYVEELVAAIRTSPPPSLASSFAATSSADDDGGGDDGLFPPLPEAAPRRWSKGKPVRGKSRRGSAARGAGARAAAPSDRSASARSSSGSYSRSSGSGSSYSSAAPSSSSSRSAAGAYSQAPSRDEIVIERDLSDFEAPSRTSRASSGKRGLSGKRTIQNKSRLSSKSRSTGSGSGSGSPRSSSFGKSRLASSRWASRSIDGSAPRGAASEMGEAPSRVASLEPVAAGPSRVASSATASRRPPARSATARPSAAAAVAAPDPLALGCPRCGAGTLITGQRGWGCSRWREGCAFVIWFQTFGRQVTAAQLRDLIQRGKTRKARFFTAAGVEIDGRLILEPATNNGAVRLEPAS